MSGRRFDIRKAVGPLAVIVGVGLLANVLIWMLLVKPKAQELEAFEEASDPKVNAAKKREEAVVALEDFVEGLRKATKDLSTLRTDHLARRDDRMVGVQRELARLCREFRIDIETVSYDNEVLGGEQLDRFAMVVPLESGYEALRRFLQSVEGSEKFLVVEKVALGESQQGNELLLNITLATYFDLPEELRPQDQRRPRPGGGRA